MLDVWFEKVLKPQCRGEACLRRYADDYVCAFEDQAEAERFYAALGPRLEKFGLTLAAEKTRILPFSRQQPPGQSSFEFLGFEFRWGQDRAGKAHLKRRTARAKLRASLQRFTQWCRENRHRRLQVLFKLGTVSRRQRKRGECRYGWRVDGASRPKRDCRCPISIAKPGF